MLKSVSDTSGMSIVTVKTCFSDISGMSSVKICCCFSDTSGTSSVKICTICCFSVYFLLEEPSQGPISECFKT